MDLGYTKQIEFAESQLTTYLKNRLVGLAVKHFAAVFGLPVLGPVFSWLLGRFLAPLIAQLVKEGDEQVFNWNTKRRTLAQGQRFEDKVDARDQSQNMEELDKAERDALAAFDDTVKYSR